MKTKAIISYEKETKIDNLDISELSDEFSLLKVACAPFSYQDWLCLQNNTIKYPYIPGKEAVGYLEKINKKSRCLSYGLENAQEGDLVYIEPSVVCLDVTCKTCLKGSYSLCAGGRRYGENDIKKYPYLLGAFSEYMVILPGSKIYKLSDDLQINHFNLIGLISKAIRAISKKGKASIGDNLLVLGFDLFSICCALVAKHIGLNKVIIFDKDFDDNTKNI